MDVLTCVNDTNIQICINLDYYDILNMREVCKNLCELLQKDNFWKMYLYHRLHDHQINPSLLEKYRPQIEPYLLSYRNYFTTRSIDQAIKNNRLDSIIFMKVNELEPCMWTAQMACKHGNVNALEFFNEEYGILPTDQYLAKMQKELSMIPKRKKDKKKYPYELAGEYGIVGAYGAIGAYGEIGPVGPIGPRGATGMMGATGPGQEKYAIHVAIEKDHVHVLDWLYSKDIKPGYTAGRQVSYRYNTEAYKWLKYMNEKDNIGLVIN